MQQKGLLVLIILSCATGTDVFLYPLFFYFHAIYIKIYTSLFIFCCNFAFCFK